MAKRQMKSGDNYTWADGWKEFLDNFKLFGKVKEKDVAQINFRIDKEMKKMIRKDWFELTMQDGYEDVKLEDYLRNALAKGLNYKLDIRDDKEYWYRKGNKQNFQNYVKEEDQNEEISDS